MVNTSLRLYAPKEPQKGEEENETVRPPVERSKKRLNNQFPVQLIRKGAEGVLFVVKP